MKRIDPIILLAGLMLLSAPRAPLAADPHVVLMTDFGVKDGAVAEMKGVIANVDEELMVDDLTHEIEPFNIWDGSYRLNQTMKYWPDGTVFVSVVDPGVGTSRNSVVVEIKDPGTDRKFWLVTPNNGTSTHLAQSLQITRVREIDEEKNRLPSGSTYHTFHGRDLFAYTGARLARKKVGFEDVGRALEIKDLVTLPNPAATVDGGVARGFIPALDVNFGNVWTNIPAKSMQTLGVKEGDKVAILIQEGDREVWKGSIPFARTFGAVPEGEPLAYVNSLDQIGVALNMKSFSAKHGIHSGPSWKIEIRKDGAK